jgi:uncharacterized protein (TIGR03435 family)
MTAKQPPTIGAALSALLWCGVCAAQPVAFDVVSIKLHPPPLEQGFPGAGGPMGPMFRIGSEGRLQFSPDKVSGENVTTRALILSAYHLPPIQLSGGPDWLDVERFDIEAKAGRPADEADLRLMLQTLLANRFKLAVHHEQKVEGADALVVGTHGPKLREWKEGAPWPPRSQKKKIGGVFRAHGTMTQLAAALSADPRAYRPVVDKTGLPGVYFLQLEWEEGGDMRTALRDLGLKIRGVRTAIDILVVDRIEQPTEN